MARVQVLAWPLSGRSSSAAVDALESGQRSTRARLSGLNCVRTIACLPHYALAYLPSLALGVGSKVAAGLGTPEARRFNSDLSTPSDRPDYGYPRLSMSTKSSMSMSPLPSPPTENPRPSSVSVLHSIMEQGQ